MGHDNWPAPDPANELDNCVRCLGLNGGVRGNENRIDGRVLCDYCHVEVLIGRPAEIICGCGRPLGKSHRVVRMDQIEAMWEQGIILTICNGEANEYDKRTGIVVAIDDPKPEDPCDEDFMKEIST